MIEKPVGMLDRQEHSRDPLRFWVGQRLAMLPGIAGATEVATRLSRISDAIGVDYAAPERGHSSISKQPANSTLSRRRPKPFTAADVT